MYDCTEVHSAEYYMPRHPADGGGYKKFFFKKRNEINGTEVHQVCPWVRIQNRSKAVVPAQG